MDEPIEAEIQPTRWTLSPFGRVLLGAAIGFAVGEGLSGSWADYRPAIVCLVAFPVVYVAARRPTPVEASYEEGRLIIRDLRPWWKRLVGPAWGGELRLEVGSVEQGKGGLVVTGFISKWWTGLLSGRSYRVRLKPEEERIEALEARLAEMGQE